MACNVISHYKFSMFAQKERMNGNLQTIRIFYLFGAGFNDYPLD